MTERAPKLGDIWSVWEGNMTEIVLIVSSADKIGNIKVWRSRYGLDRASEHWLRDNCKLLISAS